MKALRLCLVCVAGLFLTLSASFAQTPGGFGPAYQGGGTSSGGGGSCTLANPTATAGPTAVNGSAGTCMRSDGAPAIQLGTNAQLGLAEGDGLTIGLVSGVASTLGQVVAGTSQTISAAQWAAGGIFYVTTAAQTLTLPLSSTLSNNGTIAIQTIGQSVTLAPNASDAINGGTAGASVTIASGLTAYVTKGSAANTINVSPTTAGTGTVTSVNIIAGTNVTESGTCNSTTAISCTINSSGGGGGTVVYGSLGGCGLSNDGTSPNTVLDIAACQAADSANASYITLAAFTKTTGSWVAGTGNGGMGTGGGGLTVASNTWYHVCLAEISGSADVFFDTDVACSTHKPTGTTAARRIGSFKTCDTLVCASASTNIALFSQSGDRFTWLTSAPDVVGVTIGTTATLETLDVPPGVIVQAFGILAAQGTASGVHVTVYNPALGATTTTVAAADVITVTGQFISAPDEISTNTSSQIYIVADTAGSTAYWNTRGWVDRRGAR